jgi:nucleoside-diphosphate-sugar epimerase
MTPPLSLLMTGASGFLGAHVKPLLAADGFAVTTAGIDAGDDYAVNLAAVVPSFAAPFDVVLHAAGKAHTTPHSPAACQAFFDVNLRGTQNLCAGLERVGVPKSFIFISTVAVYGAETGENITEDHPLLGTSPYALSKIRAEQFLQDWAAKQNVCLTILRPALLAGKHPPGNLGAMVKAIAAGRYLSIGKGGARKSILMASDIAILVRKTIFVGGVYNVCDNRHPSFRELETLIATLLSKKKPMAIPYGIIRLLAKIGDLIGARAPFNTAKLHKITRPLTFSNEKAKTTLQWEPTDVLTHFIPF